MKGRFSRSEAAGLFGLLFACCLAFFLLGVYAGREFFSQPSASPAAMPKPVDAGEETRPDLDFYSGLVPSGEGSAGQQEGSAGREEAVAAPARRDVPASAPDQEKAAEETGGSPASPRAAQPPDGAPLRDFWTVQVGALNTREEARQVILRLEAKGYSARLSEPGPGTDSFFRVWVGEFEDEAAARLFEGRLKADGFHTYPKKVQAPGVP